MSTGVTELLDRYYDWLRSHSSENEFDSGWRELTVPFLDRHNDFLSVYVRENHDGSYRLTDDGEIIRDLGQSDCRLDTPKRRLLLEAILRGHGLDDGLRDDLVAQADEANFPERLHSLLQAMLAIDGLALTAPATVEAIFREDVSAFLREKGIRFGSGVEFKGKSGLKHQFDIHIPANSHPERVIQAITTPDRLHTQSFVYEVRDTRDARPDGELEAFAFLNDRGRRSLKVEEILWKNEIEPMKWSRKDQAIRRLLRA